MFFVLVRIASECTKSPSEYSCANCNGNHAAWSLSCNHRVSEMKKNRKPTMAQVASATVTPAYLEEIVNTIKEQIALVVAEVVARCLSELTLDLVNKTVSKVSLPLKVATVANNTVKAVNKAGFGTKVIDALTVKETILKKCFDPEGKSAPNAQGSPMPKNATQSQNVQ